MDTKDIICIDNQIIMHASQTVCSTSREMLASLACRRVLRMYLDRLGRGNGPTLAALGLGDREDLAADLAELFDLLVTLPLDKAVAALPWAAGLVEPKRRAALHVLVEGLYNFWRSFERIMILHSPPGPSAHDRRPFRAFNYTVEALTHLVRSVYRDLCENITGDHPRIYRQVPAGCSVGLIAVPSPTTLPKTCPASVGNIPFVRQVWIEPPLIIDPPSNTRTGRFVQVDENPLHGLAIDPTQWVCYPACVGPLVIFVYIHQRFASLGVSLANLFELASDEQIAGGPDAVYFYGAEAGHMAKFGELPTVFYDPTDGGPLVAAVPGEDRFGYFGYLKKMVLTLHNIVMMKRGHMPFHGAMVRIALAGGESANVLILGDTATGKSESLEALRTVGGDRLAELVVIADDMGSIDVDGAGRLLGYGTETGAFVRLDDLQAGYAFGQIDRAIIMSPQKVNARVVLPVTTLEDVLAGTPVDLLLYANNYEQVDDTHPVLERFDTAELALHTFREGAAMAKGTTTATGLVHSYFANIFGPPQYRDLHEPLARQVFEAAFAGGVFVGQLRTRLGVGGYEQTGPHEAAEALLALIAQRV